MQYVEDFEWLRWTGAAVLALVLLLGLFIISKYPLGKQASISLHIATNRVHYIMMGLLLTFGGALFYSFIILWLIPTYSLSSVMYALLIIAFLAQLGLAWIPDKKPDTPRDMRLHRVHFVCGAIVAFAMILYLYVVCGSYEYLAPLSKVLVLLSAVFSTACVFIYSFYPKSRIHFLIYESVFICLFAGALFSLILKI